MDDQRDLRVSKTLRAIVAAFMDLIVRKPVQKITVTELARRAEISKGTFYLHYLDIFDLYDKLVRDTAAKLAASFDPYPDLFADPVSFVRTFLFSQVEPFRERLSAGERALLSAANFPFCSNYPRCFIDAFRAQIYQVGKLTLSEENDIRVDFLLTGMLSILIDHRLTADGNEQKKAFIIHFLAAVVKETFPEFYGSPGP